MYNVLNLGYGHHSDERIASKFIVLAYIVYVYILFCKCKMLYEVQRYVNVTPKSEFQNQYYFKNKSSSHSSYLFSKITWSFFLPLKVTKSK